MENSILHLKIPKGFMNCEIGYIENQPYFIADTNDSANWDTIQIPLPTGKWEIVRNDLKTNTLELWTKTDK